MSSATDKYPHLTTEMVRNVIEKVRHFQLLPQDKDVLTVAVYGDHESVSSRMWHSIFRGDVNFCYSTDSAQIPIPAYYKPQKYEQYEKELKQYIADYVRNKNIIWELYNVSTPGEDPRMHLVLASRRVKKSELGHWAQSEKSSLRGSRSSLKESSGEGSGTMPSTPLRGSRASSLRELTQADSGGEGSGGTLTSSPRGSSRTSVKEVGRTDSGEGSGTLTSSPRRSSRTSSVRDISRAGSRERSGTRSAGGSSRDLSVGGRSSAGSSASLSSVSSAGSHEDPRFISIETLRSLVSSLLEFAQLSSIQEVQSSSSSSSTTTSSSEKIRKLVRAFQRSGTSTSTEELSFYSEDAPAESDESSTGPSLRPRAGTYSPKHRTGPYSLKPPAGPSARPRAESTGKRRTGSGSEPPAEDKQ